MVVKLLVIEPGKVTEYIVDPSNGEDMMCIDYRPHVPHINLEKYQACADGYTLRIDVEVAPTRFMRDMPGNKTPLVYPGLKGSWEREEAMFKQRYAKRLGVSAENLDQVMKDDITEWQKYQDARRWWMERADAFGRAE